MKLFPYLLILKGKHGNHYFHIGSEMDREKTLIEIFKINEENGYYSFYSMDEYTRRIAEKQLLLARMQDPEVSDLVDKNKIEHITREIRHYKWEKEDALLYESAKAGNIGAIKQFVWQRRDSEYEELEIEQYSNPKNDDKN